MSVLYYSTVHSIIWEHYTYWYECVYMLYICAPEKERRERERAVWFYRRESWCLYKQGHIDSLKEKKACNSVHAKFKPCATINMYARCMPSSPCRVYMPLVQTCTCIKCTCSVAVEQYTDHICSWLYNSPKLLPDVLDQASSAALWASPMLTSLVTLLHLTTHTYWNEC